MALILLVVPMIVYLKEVPVNEGLKNLYSSPTVGDFFNYYKVQWLIIFTVFSTVFFSFYLYTKKIILKLNIGFIPLFVYLFLVFLSSSMSKYHDIAFMGFIDRYEGFWVILCYVIICFISAHLISNEKDIKVLFGSLMICAAILSTLGISQLFNFDFLQTDFMKQLILPQKYVDSGTTLNFKFPSRYIYSTLFNPNYVGSFCAMTLPITIVTLLFSRKTYLKIFSAILSGLVLINLIGSRSSAGIVSVIITTIALVILHRKQLLKYWVPVLGILLSSSILLIILNVSLGNIISNEITDFLPKKHVQPIYKDGDTKYLTDMTFDKAKMTIYMGASPINVVFNQQSRKLEFSDDTGSKLKIMATPKDKDRFGFDSPKYIGLTFKIENNSIHIFAPNVNYFVVIDDSGSFKFVTQSNKLVDIVKAKAVGFEGYETWASSRGYIWSRSIPLIANTLVLGHGPDTFGLYFPQNDFAGLIKAFRTPYMLVDKPHNMYLQIAINTGLFSLLAFLVFIILYIVNSFKLYFKPKKEDSFYYFVGSACVLSVTGYLIAAIANDSNVNVSPLFWIILGIGFACNRLYSRELVAPPLKLNNIANKPAKKYSKSSNKQSGSIR